MSFSYEWDPRQRFYTSWRAVVKQQHPYAPCTLLTFYLWDELPRSHIGVWRSTAVVHFK